MISLSSVLEVLLGRVRSIAEDVLDPPRKDMVESPDIKSSSK